MNARTLTDELMTELASLSQVTDPHDAFHVSDCAHFERVRTFTKAEGLGRVLSALIAAAENASDHLGRIGESHADVAKKASRVAQLLADAARELEA